MSEDRVVPMSISSDLYMCRELQRKYEFDNPIQLQEACEESLGWSPQYAKEVVKEVWSDLYYTTST